MARLAEVRASGHAVIDQEVELGLRSLAVPLYDAHARVVAAVNLGLPAGAGEIGDLVRRHLPRLLGLQAELRGVLR